MKLFAHRGFIDKENSIDGIVNIVSKNVVHGVELDVRFNTNREIVLCHDRENRNDRNDLLDDLCKLKQPMCLMIDIKAFGIDSAKKLARSVVKCIRNYTQHTYYLCSFNEYCVQELLDLRLCSKNYVTPHTYKVGVISTGVPYGLFGHMASIDFVSFNYDVIHEEVIDSLRTKLKHIEIYAWVCNDLLIQDQMHHRYKLDGIIYDIKKY